MPANIDHLAEEVGHVDLIPAPVNKKVLINSDGSTRDIVKEVLQTYADSRNQLKQFGQYFKGDTLLQTCYNIWHFWKEKVKYKIDPDGVQWIKSPAAFWNRGIDPFGDCKSFSIACACSLHALDIDGIFRFVSFGSNTAAPTHVFVVAKDNNQEVTIDCVWHSFNSTKPWSAKWDYPMTSIYKISGVDTSNGRGVLDLDEENIAGLTVGELDLLSQKQRLEIEQMLATRKHGIGSPMDNAYEVEITAVNNALADLGQQRGIKKFKHRSFIAYGHAGHPLKRVPQVRPAVLTGNEVIGLFGSRKRKAAAKLAAGEEVKGKLGKRAQSYIDKQLKRNDAGKGISKAGAKVLENMNVVVKKKKDGLFKALAKVVTAPIKLVGKAITTTALRVTLPKNAPFFLYLYIPANIIAKIPDIVQQKRMKAITARDNIIHKLGMKETTFENIIRSGIMNRFGMTPEDTIAKWMKDANFQISGILDFATQGLNSLAGALGLNFKDMEDATPDPTDWGAVSQDTLNALATQVQNSNPLPVPDSSGVFPGTYGGTYGNYGSTIPKQNADGSYPGYPSSAHPEDTDTSYIDGQGRWWPDGSTDANGVHYAAGSPGDPDNPTGSGALTKSKVLPEVSVTAEKKDNTPVLAGLGLLGLALLSSKPKARKKK